jgi:hypothetical protein
MNEDERLTIDREDYEKCFEILEVSPSATLLEIRKAYLQLKELYSRESIATIPLNQEMTEGDKKEILDELEEAYQKLLILFESRSHASGEQAVIGRFDSGFEKAVSDVSCFSGPVLRKIREGLRIDLRDVAFATRIPVHHLENIENENYEALPPEVYTRGFVVSYAKYLSIDSNRVAADYMDRYREQKTWIRRKK